MPPTTLVALREVAKDEGEELALLRVQAMRESLERVGRFDPTRAKTRFLSGFSPSDTRHIVAGDLKVGFVVVRQVGVELLLDHLYIHPEHQGQGIGSATLDIVFLEADRASRALRVGALKQSRSSDFYIRHGFQATEQGEWDNYYVRLPQPLDGAELPENGGLSSLPTTMTDTTPDTTPQRPPLPDHLSVDPRSPHHVAAVFEHDIGIRFNNKERMDVEEYCISEGWVKVPAGKTLDRKGRPLMIKIKGKVEAFYRDQA